MKSFLTAAAFCAATLSGAAHSAIVTYEGNNIDGPTYNRAVADFSALSGVGTDVSYDIVSFSVDQPGTYTFLETARYDSFLFLYGGGFDPANARANGVAANDDLVSVGTSGFSAFLSPSTSYFAVLTSYGNGEEGDHSLTLGGPGAISLSNNGASDIFTHAGTNADGPTFDRPLPDFSGMAGAGVDVSYDMLTFSVDQSGFYSFLETADYDSFLYLYEGGFNPANPLVNGVVASDDLLGLTTSGFAADLTAGLSYTVVLTSFVSGETGLHSLTISGPGTVMPVPEPASWALMIAGLGLVGAACRYRRAATRPHV